MKSLMVLLLAAVVVALFGAGVFMLRRRPADETDSRQRDRRMARALALRVGLSVLLFLLILLSWAMGWVRPSGLPVGV
jgi:Protein of unknown function (DUF2909)